MKQILLFLIVCLIGANALTTTAQEAIAPSTFSEKIFSGEAIQLIDVRTAGEFENGHISNAKNTDIRSATFGNQVAKLDKKRPVYVYCLSGGRSASAAKQLAAMGFTQVYDLQGGIMAWKRAGLPLETSNVQSIQSYNGKDEFERTINTKLPVLIDFYAPWCGPCKKMAPMLDELKKEYEGKFILGAFNADKNDALMKELDVTEIPTLFVYKNGTVTWTHVGLVDKQTLIKELGL